MRGVADIRRPRHRACPWVYPSDLFGTLVQGSWAAPEGGGHPNSSRHSEQARYWSSPWKYANTAPVDPAARHLAPRRSQEPAMISAVDSSSPGGRLWAIARFSSGMGVGSAKYISQSRPSNSRARSPARSQRMAWHPAESPCPSKSRNNTPANSAGRAELPARKSKAGGTE